MKSILIRASVAFFVIFIYAATTAHAQSSNYDPVAPMVGGAYAPDNHLFAGYQYIHTKYDLVSGTETQHMSMTGLKIDYVYHPPRFVRNLALLGSVRYSQANILSAKMMTGAAGGAYTVRVRRFRPFVEGLAGMARLTSHDREGNVFLSNKPLTGFTTIIGAGVNMRLKTRWGIRPFSIEQQRAPFGSLHSGYLNIGCGVLFYPTARAH